ncbi:hypothetical protein MBLNU13_g03076t2 [Cladosporium sp. NU13]
MEQHYDLATSDGVQSYLQTHGYPTCISVERLAEGWSGFVYRAQFREGNNPSVIIKHVENFAARLPEFQIGQDRMVYEAKGLEFLSRPSTNTKVAHVRVPRLLAFDGDNFVLIMEDAGDVPTLKSWLRADSPHDQVVSVGRSLGAYLAHIHNTTANNSAIKDAFGSNIIAKNTSSSVYFAALPGAAKKFGYTQPFIAAAADFAAKEVLTANEVWTLGDFWTGNVLVSAPSGQSEPDITVLDLELAKPGTAAFDVGHMGAEMLCLARFRFEDKGTLLLQTFFQSYKAESKAKIDAAAVAIRIPWTAESGEAGVKEVLEEGFELLKMGWEKDELALKRSVVGVLMD